MYLLRLLISTSDSLLQTRTSIQIASPKYAPWDPSVTMAMWANGFPHKHEGNKATAKEGLRIVWWMLPCNQRGQTIAPLRALWFYQAWYWLDLFCMLGKSFNFHFNSCAFKKLGENPQVYGISNPRSRFIKIPFERCKKRLYWHARLSNYGASADAACALIPNLALIHCESTSIFNVLPPCLVGPVSSGFSRYWDLNYIPSYVFYSF